MWLDLEKIFDKLSGDANVRAVILSGAGDRAFTTGLDVVIDLLQISSNVLTVLLGGISQPVRTTER